MLAQSLFGNQINQITPWYPQLIDLDKCEQEHTRSQRNAVDACLCGRDMGSASRNLFQTASYQMAPSAITSG